MMAQDPPPPSTGEMKNNNQLAMGSCIEEGKGSKVIAVVMRMGGDKEGDGVGNKGGVR
jgi:hypothetical protein